MSAVTEADVLVYHLSVVCGLVNPGIGSAFDLPSSGEKLVALEAAPKKKKSKKGQAKSVDTAVTLKSTEDDQVKKTKGKGKQRADDQTVSEDVETSIKETTSAKAKPKLKSKAKAKENKSADDTSERGQLPPRPEAQSSEQTISAPIAAARPQTKGKTIEKPIKEKKNSKKLGLDSPAQDASTPVDGVNGSVAANKSKAKARVSVAKPATPSIPAIQTTPGPSGKQTPSKTPKSKKETSTPARSSNVVSSPAPALVSTPDRSVRAVSEADVIRFHTTSTTSSPASPASAASPPAEEARKRKRASLGVDTPLRQRVLSKPRKSAISSEANASSSGVGELETPAKAKKSGKSVSKTPVTPPTRVASSTPNVFSTPAVARRPTPSVDSALKKSVKNKKEQAKDAVGGEEKNEIMETKERKGKTSRSNKDNVGSMTVTPSKSMKVASTPIPTPTPAIIAKPAHGEKPTTASTPTASSSKKKRRLTELPIPVFSSIGTPTNPTVTHAPGSSKAKKARKSSTPSQLSSAVAQDANGISSPSKAGSRSGSGPGPWPATGPSSTPMGTINPALMHMYASMGVVTPSPTKGVAAATTIGSPSGRGSGRKVKVQKGPKWVTETPRA